MAIGADDLVINVHLNTVQAQRELQKQEQAAKQLGSSVGAGMSRGFGMALGGIGAGLGAIFGPTIVGATTDVLSSLGNIGRLTSIGQGVERTTMERETHERARQATVEAFGMAGATASNADIMGVYKAFLEIERMQGEGQLKVERVANEAKLSEELENVMRNLNTFFSDVLGNSRNASPEIR